MVRLLRRLTCRHSGWEQLERVTTRGQLTERVVIHRVCSRCDRVLIKKGRR